jgi:hypothetical protein
MSRREEGTVPFSEREGGQHFFRSSIRHFSKRDRVTLRMHTPQHERNLEVWAANALNRSIALYIIFRYPFSVKDFPRQCKYLQYPTVIEKYNQGIYVKH